MAHLTDDSCPIFFARSEFIPLSLGNLFQMVAAESSKTIAKCRFARKKSLVENRLKVARYSYQETLLKNRELKTG
jgi:hypothetical protein